MGLAEPVDQAAVAGEDDREDGARVEVGGRQQADLGDHRGQQLLGLVDEHHGPHAGVVDMGEPSLAQVFEAGPAVVVHQVDAEHPADLAVEVGQPGRGVGDGTDPEPVRAAEAVGEHAQRHALSGAGLAGDQREAALAHKMMLDSEAEAVDGGAHHEAVDRKVGGEGVPFEPVEGEQLAVHDGSP